MGRKIKGPLVGGSGIGMILKELFTGEIVTKPVKSGSRKGR